MISKQFLEYDHELIVVQIVIGFEELNFSFQSSNVDGGFGELLE